MKKNRDKEVEKKSDEMVKEIKEGEVEVKKK